MFKRIASMLFGGSGSEFNSYYNRLLLSGPVEFSPTAREAKLDYKRYLDDQVRSTYSSRLV